MKKIFPKEIIPQSLEYHRYKYLQKSQRIYMILLLGFVSIALLLPLIYIDLYTASPGMLRPEKDRNLISCPINGKVKQVTISNNSFVTQGDTLVMLDDTDIITAIKHIKNQIDSINLHVQSLQFLIRSNDFNPDSIGSSLHKSQLKEYLQKVYSLHKNIGRALVNFNRQEHLFNKGVIARVEYQRSTAKLEIARNELLILRNEQKIKWEKELHFKRAELKNLQSKLLEFKKNEKLHYIIAPLSGTIQNLTGIEKNSFLFSGSSIAEISPHTDLQVECYVSPSDIGMIKKNHKVSFQIDAFDHNYWGLATGKILQISEDSSIINQLPMYKVICSIRESHLLLNNKIRGELRKGMTLNAHFFIKKRSLFQLLFDDIKDWYQPS